MVRSESLSRPEFAEPSKEGGPPLLTALDSIEESLSIMDEQLRRLRDRLAPITRETEPAMEKKLEVPRQSKQSPVLRRLDDIRDRVETNYESTQELLDRLEL